MGASVLLSSMTNLWWQKVCFYYIVQMSESSNYEWLPRTSSLTSSVLTMYEKSGAKAAKHSWTSSTTSISVISYLAVRCYQHTRQWQFRAMECPVTRTTQFSHLPLFAFLCIVPQGMICWTSSNHKFLELLPGPFETILQGLNTDKEAVVLAVKQLLRPPRRNRANTFNDDE